MKTRNLFGINISIGKYSQVLRELLHLIEGDKAVVVAPVALHPLTEAIIDDDYKYLLNRIDYVLPDSYWHKAIINYLDGYEQTQQIYGPRLFVDLARNITDLNLNICLFGCSNNKEMKHLIKMLNNMGVRKENVAGYVASFDINNDEIKSLAKVVRKNKSRVIFVGVGSPKQHYLAEEIRNISGVTVVAVGAAFDFYSGKSKIAPDWVRKIGFEWLYRLFYEPRRLVGRYIKSFIVIFPLVVIEKVKIILQIQR